MRWLINILSNYLRFVVNMGVVFVMTPYIISVIGTERFGLWSLIFALVAMFGLLDEAATRQNDSFDETGINFS